MVFVLAIVLIALALSIWIVVPGPTPFLFGLSVATTELWPVIALLDFISLALALRFVRGRMRFAAIAACVVALSCSLVPLYACIVRGHIPLAAFITGARGPSVSVRTQRLPGMLVFAPQIPAKRPVIITIYGGAWEHGSTRTGRALNEILASWGYVVFAIDYRHAPQARWPAQRHDVLAGITAARAAAPSFGGDPARVVLIGHSSGAQLAMIAGSDTRLHLRAIVTYESPVDLTLGYEFPSQPDIIHIRGILGDLCGGTPVEKPACYRSASPRYVVHKGMPPVFMIAAGRDHVVDVRFEHLLRDALRKDGVAVTYLELPWADHAFEVAYFGFHNRIAMWYLRPFLARATAQTP